MENPVISLRQNYLGEGLIRLDVVLTNAPKNLFGLAFHLKLRGDEWHLQKSEPGNVLNMSGGPLFLATPSVVFSDEVVVGVSARRGQDITVRDGVVASLWLETKGRDDIAASFSDGHLRLSGPAQREAADVVWNGATLLRDASFAQNLEANLVSFSPMTQGQNYFDVRIAAVYETMGVALIVLVLLCFILMLLRLRALKRKKTLT